MKSKTFWEKLNTFLSNLGFFVGLIALLCTGMLFYLDTKADISLEIMNPQVAPIGDGKLFVKFDIKVSNNSKFDAENVSIKIKQISKAMASELINWGSTRISENLSLNRKSSYQSSYFINLGGDDAKPILDGILKSGSSEFPVILETRFFTRSVKTWFLKREFISTVEYQIACSIALGANGKDARIEASALPMRYNVQEVKKNMTIISDAWRWFHENDMPNWFSIIVWPLILFWWSRRTVSSVPNLEVSLKRGATSIGKQQFPATDWHFLNNTGSIVYLTNVAVRKCTGEFVVRPEASRDIVRGSHELKFSVGDGNLIERQIIMQTDTVHGSSLAMQSPVTDEFLSYKQEFWRALLKQPKFFCLEYTVLVGNKRYKVSTTY